MGYSARLSVQGAPRVPEDICTRVLISDRPQALARQRPPLPPTVQVGETEVQVGGTPTQAHHACHPHLWLSLARYSANIRTAWSSGAEEGLISSRTTPYFLCGQDKWAVSCACPPPWFIRPKHTRGSQGSSITLVRPQHPGPRQHPACWVPVSWHYGLQHGKTCPPGPATPFSS